MSTAAVASRVLSARQVATQERLMQAGLALASERGIDFTMRDVAASADVATATTYTYFASKEHLLAEVYASWVDQLTERLDERPPASADVVERVQSVIRRATAGIEASPKLAAAFTLAMASSDKTVAMIRPRIHSSFSDWLAVALSTTEVTDRGVVIQTLERCMYAGMIAHAHGSIDAVQLRSDLYATARVLLERTT